MNEKMSARAARAQTIRRCLAKADETGVLEPDSCSEDPNREANGEEESADAKPEPSAFDGAAL